MESPIKTMAGSVCSPFETSDGTEGSALAVCFDEKHVLMKDVRAAVETVAVGSSDV